MWVLSKWNGMKWNGFVSSRLVWSGLVSHACPQPCTTQSTGTEHSREIKQEKMEQNSKTAWCSRDPAAERGPLAAPQRLVAHMKQNKTKPNPNLCIEYGMLFCFISFCFVLFYRIASRRIKT
mmetsp:Transcript_29031/g.68227  ORF Transcript_29031/g.68227 Transcript_29031/m.68227 type:complete len:122 (+) Transcript_29031:417-782(+)